MIREQFIVKFRLLNPRGNCVEGIILRISGGTVLTLSVKLTKISSQWLIEMLIRNQKLILSVAMQNRLISYTVKRSPKPSQKSPQIRRKFSVKIDKKKFLDSLSSNYSIKPYLNVEKVDVIEPFLHTRNDFKCTYNFVTDEVVARDIAKKVLSDHHKDKSIIMEGNPGLGLITINLINSSVSHIVVFDSSQMQEFSLNQLINKHPKKITKKEQNMNICPEVVILTAFDLTRKDGLLWTFIGTATSFYFLRSLVLTAIKYELWEYDMNVYLLLSSPVLNELKSGGGKIKFLIYCGLHLLYSIEEVARYPRRAFLPHSHCDNEDMNLVRIKRNPNLFKIMEREELSEYFIFTSLLGSNRKNFVIQTLEKWLPDCGPYLISKGISMTHQVSDLSANENITLFKFFRECSGYEVFKTCSSHMFVK